MDINNFYQHRRWSLEYKPHHKVEWKYCPVCGYERPAFMFDKDDKVCKYHTDEEIELWIFDDDKQKN